MLTATRSASIAASPASIASEKLSVNITLSTDSNKTSIASSIVTEGSTEAGADSTEAGADSTEAGADSTEAGADSTGRRIQQRSNYSVKKKRELIALAQVAGVREVSKMEGVPRRTLRHWLEDDATASKVQTRESPLDAQDVARFYRMDGNELSYSRTEDGKDAR